MREHLTVEKVCYGVLALVILMQAAFFVTRPISEHDFWWHLKTGELLAQSKALLPADPFNYTGDQSAVSPRERVILDGYWLWQVVAFGFYQAIGFAGIKLLNGLTLLAIYASIAWSFARNRVPATIVLPLLATSLLLLSEFYFLERPQVVSFLLATVVAGFLVDVRQGRRPSGWLYPLMAVWGNCHGGVIVGVAMLGSFAAGSLWDLRGDRPRLKAVLLWCGLGIVVSFLNPVGSGYYLGLFSGVNHEMFAKISEYSSFFSRSTEGTVLLLGGLMILHFWALVKGKAKSCLADWLVSLLLCGLALRYSRNFAFVGVSLLPLSGYYLARQFAETTGCLPVIFGRGALICAAIVGALLTWSAGEKLFAAKARGEWGMISHTLPEKAGNFLASAKLSGRIYNEYDWGGYLLWRLYPQYRLFIDGRGIDEQTFADALKIAKASRVEVDGRPEYALLLDQYGIDFAILGIEVKQARLNPLWKQLFSQQDWLAAYFDGQACVLVKNNGENSEFLRANQIPKKIFIDRLLAAYNRALLLNPKDYVRYLGRAELFTYIGREADARQDLAVAGRLRPDDPAWAERLQKLESARDNIPELKD